MSADLIIPSVSPVTAWMAALATVVAGVVMVVVSAVWAWRQGRRR